MESQKYQLSADVILVPVVEVDDAIKNSFDWSTDDYLISFKKSRKTSQLISVDIKNFLEEFSEPQQTVVAILSFISKTKMDIEKHTMDLLLTLNKFISDGVLVIDNNLKPSTVESLLSIGDNFKGYNVAMKIQSGKDGEVYQLKMRRSKYLLKIIDRTASDKYAKAKLKNERNILQVLKSPFIPKLVACGKDKKFEYIITSWIEGTSLEEFVKKFPARNRAIPATHKLALKVLQTYASLHKLNTLHGDVHANNIIITKDNKVRLIDFGLAVSLNKKTKPVKRREAWQFFIEPEFARMKKGLTRSYRYTSLGEQYAIACLLYEIYTGNNYMDFSLERDKFYDQVINGQPFPFIYFGVANADKVEMVLQKALTKSPKLRYPNTASFLKSLKSVMFSNRKASGNLKFNNHLADTIISKFGINSSFIENGVLRAPYSSLSFGYCGLAYFFLHAAQSANNGEYMSVAEIYTKKALENIHLPEAFFSKEFSLESANIDRFSFYHGLTGVYHTQILHSLLRADKASASHLLKQLSEELVFNPANIDATVGMSSVLLSASHLMARCKASNIPVKVFAETINAKIFNPLWSHVNSCKENKKVFKYNGMAHGWAGLLYTSLTWLISSGTELPGNYMDHLDFLLSKKRTPVKNEIIFSINDENDEAWNGWCHGTAGYIFLFDLLYRTLHENKFLAIACMLGNHLLANINPESTRQLCCGLSGQAYALQRLFKTTTDTKWQLGARTFAQLSLANNSSVGLLDHSLFKGELGIAIMEMDLASNLKSGFPLFEL